jgi:hypothetical protein
MSEEKMIEAIRPEEFKHLQKVNAEVEQAKALVSQAMANLNKAQGAQQGHWNYLEAAYKLEKQDSVDLSTGQINRVK